MTLYFKVGLCHILRIVFAGFVFASDFVFFCLVQCCFCSSLFSGLMRDLLIHFLVVLSKRTLFLFFGYNFC